MNGEIWKILILKTRILNIPLRVIQILREAPYNYSGWIPLEPALKYYEECLDEPWTKRAVLVKRESYYYKEKDDVRIILKKGN